MNKLFTAIFTAIALAGCAASQPVVAKPSCIKSPPPNLTGHKIVFAAPPKTLDQKNGIVALIVEGKSFIDFTEWVDQLSQWADKSYEACRDPKAPPVSEVGSTVERGHDEDEK